MAALKNILENLQALERKQDFNSKYQYESKLLAHVTYRHGSGRSLKRYESYRLKVEFGACLVRTVS